MHIDLRRWTGLCGALFVAGSLTACATNPVTGRPQLALISEAQEIQMGQQAARDSVSAIKFHVAGVLGRVLDRAIQVHGALGMTDETPLAWWYRHERAARIYDGPDEVHKSVVAREILKPYGVNVAI